jgi:hypothetical protein
MKSGEKTQGLFMSKYVIHIEWSLDVRYFDLSLSPTVRLMAVPCAICSEEPGTRHVGSGSLVLLRRPIAAQSSSAFL